MKFYSDNEAEPKLYWHRESIVPYLLTESKKKDIPKREYAILAVGRIGDKRALLVLQAIILKDAENQIIRDNALWSIWKYRFGSQ